MDPALAIVVVLALVAATAVAGLVWRRRDGRARTVDGPTVAAVDLGLPGGDTSVFGENATLVQFSTEMCARCPATRRLLDAIAESRPGVRHVDVDLTHRPDIASRFGILQTPTTLVLDEHARQVARIPGAPMRAAVEEVLDRLAVPAGSPLPSDSEGSR